MKTALAIAVVLVLIAGFPPASTSAETVTERLALVASLAVADYNQSVEMFFGNEGLHEINPVLGTSPRRGDLIAFGLVGIGLTYVIYETLPTPWNRIAVDSIIASERMNIEENRRVYLGANSDGPPLRGREVNAIPIIISLRF
jgi:hypothetical protein